MGEQIKVATFASESGHWYDKHGNQITEIDGKKPDFRNKLVIRHDLAPGVTTIMRQKAAPGLTRWLQQEAIRCALTMPRKPEQTEQEWLDAILDDSKETAKAAADEGTKIHAAIEASYRGDMSYDVNYDRHVVAVRELLAGIAPGEVWLPEKSVASPYGYGTKSDLHSPRWVIDFKGTEKPKEELRVYPEHWMQLAATRAALMDDKLDKFNDQPPGTMFIRARCLIVYIHRTEAWAHAVEVKEQELAKGWELFKCCLRMWQVEKNYRPSWASEP